MDPLSATASVVAVFQLSTQVLSLCREYYSEIKTARSDIEKLVVEIQTFQNVLQKLKTNAEGLDASKLFVTASCEDNIRQCSYDLENLKSRLELEKHGKRMKRFGLRALKWPFTSPEVDRVISTLERQKLTFNLALGLDQISLALATERDQNLAKLSYVEGATFNSYRLEHEALCFANTRVDVLNQITKWSLGPQAQTIFWLNGMAGTGKSTIARTIAHTFAEQKRLGASFFFSRGVGDLGRAQKFFGSIALQLARLSATLKGFIADAIAEHSDISQQSLREQWNHLIFRPFQKLDSCQYELLDLIIVIDALDECEEESDIRTIIQLLTQTDSFTRHRIRIFLTSRPEIPIRLGFNQMAQILYQDLILHDLPSPSTEHDVTIFLRHELELIREAHGIPSGWPGEQDFKVLVEKTGRLFIFAATACRFIGDDADDPIERLPLVIGEGPAHHFQTKELDKIYIQVLKRCIARRADGSERAQQYERFRIVVGHIIALFDTLPATALAGLLSTKLQTISVTLRSLHSVLHVSEHQSDPIRLLHPSFREFLFDKQRCSETAFWIDEKEVHRMIAKHCLHVMSIALKRNVCCLETPGMLRRDIPAILVDEKIPAHVQYACRYWVSHVREAAGLYGSDVIFHDDGLLEDFFRTSYLFWLEAMSLIGRIPDAIDALIALQQISKQGQSEVLRRTIEEAKLMVSNYRTAIEDSPLQIYSSVLAFSPTDSLVRNQYIQHMPSWLTGLQPIQETWGPCLVTLEGHALEVLSVVFLCNGRLLASGSVDNTVRLWDVSTGTPYATFDGHSGCVSSVAFSPNSKLIASGSHDHTVRLWDIIGGLLYVFEGHSEPVDSVVFSPDGQLVGSGSYDNTIKLWDTTTGTLRTTLQGFDHHVFVGLKSGICFSIIFSPDGKLVICGSMDNTIRLYDTATGQTRATFNGHSDKITSVAISPNGQVVASKSHDSSIKLWDVVTAKTLHTLESCLSYVSIVKFSPNGRLIAAPVEDAKTIGIWDTMTGARLNRLAGHSDIIQAIVFSPNGHFIASASKDSTIIMWEISGGSLHATFKGHSGGITTLDFSPDSCVLASGSYDGTVKVWTAAERPAPAEMELHSGYVYAVKFSPDGKLVASGSTDNTIKLWQTVTGALSCTLQGHSDWVESVGFSTDGQTVASGSFDKTVKLWDTKGKLKHTLTGHEDVIESIAFSLKNDLIASASRDKTVRLWHRTGGAPIRVLEGHSGWVFSVAFSPDGAIASGSGDKTVRIWDASTGMTSHVIQAFSERVRNVAFSPTGRLLAFGSFDGMVKLWDINSDQQIARYNVCNKDIFSFDSASRLLLGLAHWDTMEDIAGNQGVAYYPLNVSTQWILYKGSRVFWLPTECRPRTYDIHENRVVLGSNSGRVTFLCFRAGWSGFFDG